MSASVSPVADHPPFQPPERSRADVSRAAAERVKQAEVLAIQAAKAERAHNRGVGTVVDVTA